MDIITHVKQKRKQESELESTTQGLYHLSHVKHIFKMGKAYTCTQDLSQQIEKEGGGGGHSCQKVDHNQDVCV